MKPIGYIGVYRDGSKYRNGSGTAVLFGTWGKAVAAFKMGYWTRHSYEADELRVVPVYM